MDRRSRRGALLASGAVPVLRRRRHVLGPRRDGPDAGEDRRDGRPHDLTAQALGVRGRVRLASRRAAAWIEPRLAHLLGLDPARTATAKNCSPRGDVLRADRGAGHRRDGLRGPPVGRPGVARLHRVDPRVVEEPSDPDRHDGEARAGRQAPNWASGQRSFTAMHLERLPDALIAELVEVRPRHAAGERRAIVARAEGCRSTPWRPSGCWPTAAR